MGTTKLALYNAALREIGETALASLSEDRSPRRRLDGCYDQALAACLEEGQWNFAARAVKIDKDEDSATDFGYANVFTKPSDWVRTLAISADEFNATPLNDFQDEAGFWLADITPIYVRYVSDDSSYGLDLSRWPPSYVRFVELYLASLICEAESQNGQKREIIMRDLRDARRNAKSKDAMNGPSPRAPVGRLVSARLGAGSGQRGSRGSLIG